MASFGGWFNNTHRGTSRCREREPSTPSVAVRPSLSLAVGAAGWVGFRSPGDHAALQFQPTPRHDPCSAPSPLPQPRKELQTPGSLSQRDVQGRLGRSTCRATGFKGISLRRPFWRNEHRGSCVKSHVLLCVIPAPTRLSPAPILRGQWHRRRLLLRRRLYSARPKRRSRRQSHHHRHRRRGRLGH